MGHGGNSQFNGMLFQVLAAGALMSPRLLLQSGVGSFHRQDEIFPDGFSVPFHIHNRAIGTTLFDHVATSLT
jgi:hypothetical protein